MTQLQAKRLAAKTTAPRFGLLMESGIGVWIYECRSIPANKNFGIIGHEKRFRGCLSDTYSDKGSRFQKYIYNGGSYKRFGLVWQLTRTDWKVSIISERVLDALLLDKNN